MSAQAILDTPAVQAPPTDFLEYLEAKVTSYGFPEPKRSVWLRYMSDPRRGEGLLKQALAAMGLAEDRDCRVLDLGCGFGGLLMAIERRFGRAYGVEILEERARWSRRRAGASVVCADASALPWTDGHFGAIISTDVFEHINFHKQALAAREMFRVLAPGGSAYLTVPNRFQWRDNHNYVWFGTWLPPKLRAAYTRRVADGGAFLQCWERSQSGWCGLFEAAGFHVEVRKIYRHRWQAASLFQLILKRPLAAERGPA